MPLTLPPTPVEMRAVSELLTAKYPTPGSPDPMQTLLDMAISQVQALTARILDPGHPELAFSPWATPEPTPAGLVPVAVRATALMAEQFSVTGEARLARQRAARLRLRGFTAGPYSEQYWDPAMVRGSGSRNGRPQIVDDPDLDDALWALATEDARDELIAIATGKQPPAGDVTAFDYGANRRRVFTDPAPGAAGGGWPGPDGW